METRVYICHKNMKSIGFFTVFIKKYSTGNEEWIDFETATITSDHVLHNNLTFHKRSCRQNECTYPEKTNNTFIFL